MMLPESSLLRPDPHPLLWPHTQSECKQCAESILKLAEDQAREVAATLVKRADQIAAAVADPLWKGIEPELWQQFRLDLAACGLLYVSGPNRSTKSYWCAKDLCQAALTYPRGALLVVGKTIESSEQIQQRALWEFLQPHVGHLNGKQNPLYKIRYSEAGGFTEGLVVLPNRTRIIIETDGGEPKKWEGEEWGARIRELITREDGSVIQNIGFWLDEDISLKWIEHATRRSGYRDAKGVWSFTPKDGITPSIKELLTGAKVLETRPATLLPQARVEGCPPGHMPYRMESDWKGVRVRTIYVHIENNPMPDYRAKELKRIEGAAQEYVERFGYGYARDSIQRAFPQFGKWNLIDEEHLPEVGTNYVFCDPHDARAWFITWVRVTPGDTPDFYIYDEWPDAQTYGEWAVPSARELNADTILGWDGDIGPAQHARVDGIVGYKKIFRERLVVRAGADEKDPMRRKLLMQVEGRASRVESQHSSPRPSSVRWLPIEDYYIDSRAGPRPHIEEQGQTCTVWEFDKEHTDTETGEKLEPVRFRMVSGDKIDLNLVRELVSCRRNAEGVMTTPPRMFIVRRCRQTVWACENYTGISKERGASKDPIDNLRYIAGADLQHVATGGPKVWRPGMSEEDDE